MEGKEGRDQPLPGYANLAGIDAWTIFLGSNASVNDFCVMDVSVVLSVKGLL